MGKLLLWLSLSCSVVARFARVLSSLEQCVAPNHDSRVTEYLTLPLLLGRQTMYSGMGSASEDVTSEDVTTTVAPPTTAANVMDMSR